MEAVHRLIRKTVPKLEASMAMGMIGYGRFHYRYATGHEGDTFVIGLASRAQYISLYLCGTKNGKYVAESYRAKLPKANIGKGCVRFKHLSDLDAKTLAKLIGEGSKAPAGKVSEGVSS